jgi:hypothetical protein
VYAESIPDVARIIVAEAEGDVTTLVSYLDTVEEYVKKLKNEIQNVH